jgi:hypothetical protein
LVTGEEPGELLTPVLKVVDLLLKRLVDPSDRSAELNRISVEEMADLCERNTCISKDFDPYKIDDCLGTVAAVPGRVPHGLWE